MAVLDLLGPQGIYLVEQRGDPVSYPRDLDEFTEEELREKLARREECRARGVCDYCEKNGNAPKCRFPRRHPSRTKRAVKR